MKREVLKDQCSHINVTVAMSPWISWSLCAPKLLSGYQISLLINAYGKVIVTLYSCISLRLHKINTVSCGAPAGPINGSVYYTSTGEGSTAVIQCDEGLALQGRYVDYISMCINGSWLPQFDDQLCALQEGYSVMNVFW